MTESQWEDFKHIVKGRELPKALVGFIIDSPWIPGWYGCSTLDYYTDDRVWMEANLKAVRDFPDIMFIPGFWSEYGMCSEPSAFGAKCIWGTSSLPHADRIITDIQEVNSITKPNVKSDGLLPFVMNRLKRNYNDIRRNGHDVRIAVSRGPFNIASFLMGTTEFLMASRMEPEKTLTLINMITEFVIDWIEYQMECFPSIDGILILDDIIGFVGEEDFRNLMLPFLKDIFGKFDVSIKILHNDAAGRVSAPYLSEIGINVFNFSFEHSLQEMRVLTGDKITLLGNIPPRDVLANGTLEDITDWTAQAAGSVGNDKRIIWSCGGGMPQEVTSERIHLFQKAVSKEING